MPQNVTNSLLGKASCWATQEHGWRWLPADFGESVYQQADAESKNFVGQIATPRVQVSVGGRIDKDLPQIHRVAGFALLNEKIGFTSLLCSCGRCRSQNGTHIIYGWTKGARGCCASCLFSEASPWTALGCAVFLVDFDQTAKLGWKSGSNETRGQRLLGLHKRQCSLTGRHS